MPAECIKLTVSMHIQDNISNIVIVHFIKCSYDQSSRLVRKSSFCFIFQCNTVTHAFQWLLTINPHFSVMLRQCLSQVMFGNLRDTGLCEPSPSGTEPWVSLSLTWHGPVESGFPFLIQQPHDDMSQANQKKKPCASALPILVHLG